MRIKDYLKRRYSVILSSVGIILLLSSAIMLTPLVILFSFPHETIHSRAFILPAFFLFILGGFLWKAFRYKQRITLTVQEGGIIVILSWMIVILFSAWPFTSVLGIPYSHALFE